MEFNKEVLQQAADEGSKNVASAFSKLANAQVEVVVSQAQAVPFGDLLERVKPPEGHSIVVYAQALTGNGVSILTMSREDALALVDLLNQQAVGTTGILKDIDRSAIKETLNILSNSYVTALADSAKIELTVDVPNMITSSRLQDIINDLLKGPDGQNSDAIIFESELSIAKYEIKTALYFIFNKHQCLIHIIHRTHRVSTFGMIVSNFACKIKSSMIKIDKCSI